MVIASIIKDGTWLRQSTANCGMIETQYIWEAGLVNKYQKYQSLNDSDGTPVDAHCVEEANVVPYLKTLYSTIQNVMVFMLVMTLGAGLGKYREEIRLFEALAGDIKAMAMFLTHLTYDNQKYVAPDGKDYKNIVLEYKDNVEDQYRRMRLILAILTPVARVVLKGESDGEKRPEATTDRLETKKYFIPNRRYNNNCFPLRIFDCCFPIRCCELVSFKCKRLKDCGCRCSRWCPGTQQFIHIHRYWKDYDEHKKERQLNPATDKKKIKKILNVGLNISFEKPEYFEMGLRKQVDKFFNENRKNINMSRKDFNKKYGIPHPLRTKNARPTVWPEKKIRKTLYANYPKTFFRYNPGPTPEEFGRLKECEQLKWLNGKTLKKLNAFEHAWVEYLVTMPSIDDKAHQLYEKIDDIQSYTHLDLFETIMTVLLDEIMRVAENNLGFGSDEGSAVASAVYAKWEGIYASWGAMSSIKTFSEPTLVHMYRTVMLFAYSSLTPFNYVDYIRPGETDTGRTTLYFIFVLLEVGVFAVMWWLAYAIRNPFKDVTCMKGVKLMARKTQEQVLELLIMQKHFEEKDYRESEWTAKSTFKGNKVVNTLDSIAMKDTTERDAIVDALFRLQQVLEKALTPPPAPPAPPAPPRFISGRVNEPKKQTLNF